MHPLLVQRGLIPRRAQELLLLVHLERGGRPFKVSQLLFAQDDCFFNDGGEERGVVRSDDQSP